MWLTIPGRQLGQGAAHAVAGDKKRFAKLVDMRLQVLPDLVEGLFKAPMDHHPGGDALGPDIQVEKPVA